MYYYIKNGKKIIHEANCFHIQNTDIKNIGWYETLEEATAHGYHLCRHCNPLYSYYKKEYEQITDFSKKNGLRVYLDNACISVITIDSKWKILLNGKDSFILYHKNDFEKAKDQSSKIKGYHFQSDALRYSIVEYLDYIVEHDYFRMLHPVRMQKSKMSPPMKGTKRYKSAQRRIKKQERKQAIRNVMSIFDSLNIPQYTQRPAMAV